jgi:hypothetical protein
MLTEEKYTLEEIKNYIISQDSLGDVLYNLNKQKIEEAQIWPKLIDWVNSCYQEPETIIKTLELAKERGHIRQASLEEIKEEIKKWELDNENNESLMWFLESLY